MEQRVIFNEQMMEVGVVAQIMRDGGCSTDQIFTSIGFKLGLMDFEQPAMSVDPHFECVVQRTSDLDDDDEDFDDLDDDDEDTDFDDDDFDDLDEDEED